MLAQLPRLQLVVTTGMRNASLDVAYLRERGVTVSGTGMSSSYDTAGVPTTTEVAWALILAVLKRVTIEDARSARAAGRPVCRPTSAARRSGWRGSAGSAPRWSPRRGRSGWT